MWKKIAGVLLVAFLAPQVLKYISLMGYMKTTYNHTPGPCRIVPGIEHGSEDLQALSNGLALITSGLHMIKKENKEGIKGQIFLFDFNHPNQAAVSLPIEGNLDKQTFQPHGISLWEDKKTGKVTVFVISHLPAQEAIEKFEFDQKAKKLIHLKTITGLEAFTNYLNDLVAVSADSFYFTNYQYMRGTLEVYLQLKWASIGFYDGQNARVIADGFLMPNGINVSPDGKYLYVMHIGEVQLEVYERQKDNNIKQVQVTKLYSLCDNIDVEKSTGDLWLGCHPVGHKAMKHLENGISTSPSQVLRLKTTEGKVTEIKEIYSDDGSIFSGSTVAVKHKNSMLVGSVLTKLMYCELQCIE